MSADLLSQLNDQKRKVDFDTFDVTVKELISMVVDQMVDIAPVYQRQFRWDEERQSTFVESVFLGIPVPSLFMAANADGTWELIDGVQRLSTLIHFAGEKDALKKIGKSVPLVLTGMQKLPSFVGYTFQGLPLPIKTQFQLRPIKITTISDKSDREVRFDLFERLNTGGVVLTEQEIRSCIYRGSFNKLLRTLASSPEFAAVVKLPPDHKHDGTPEELVLKFFAYLDRYEKFQHSVKLFLNEYMAHATTTFDEAQQQQLFMEVLKRLTMAFPKGILRGSRRTTPINLFEAVSVGAALAYRQTGQIQVQGAATWINSEQLSELIAKGTNTKAKVIARINFCRDRFLGA